MIIDNMPPIIKLENHPVYKNETRYCYVEPEKYSMVGETFERNWKSEVEYNRVSVFFTADEFKTFRHDYSNTKFQKENDKILVIVQFN